MMKQKFFTALAGVLSFGIYFILINTLIYYFDYHRQNKAIHFVKKNENRIRITLSPPMEHPKKSQKSIDKKVIVKKQKASTKKQKEIIKKQKKIIKKQKTTTKKIIAKKAITKQKIIKEKVVKKITTKKIITKKQDKKVITKVTKTSTQAKSNQTTTKDLFASIDTKYNPSKTSYKTKQNTKESINSLFAGYTPNSSSRTSSNKIGKEEKRDRGIMNAYFAKIEEILKGWPAQSDFVGQRAKVWIRVEPSGKFRFRVTTASGNPEFNRGLIKYLRGLQKRGFGRHQAKRAYDLDVEFIARD